MFDRSYDCAVIGHSHAARLAAVHRDTAVRLGGTAGFPRYRFGLLQNLPRSSEQASRVAPREVVRDIFAAAMPDVVITILFGNTHNLWGLPQHPRPFDFFLPGETAAEPLPGAEIIPYGLMKRALSAAVVQQSLPILSDVRALGPDVPLRFLAPPPPVPDETFLMRHAKTFGAQFAEHGISPAPLRHKFWRLYLDILGDLASELDAEVIPVPERAIDADGYLASGYWSDVTHGNESYYALVLESIDSLARCLVR